MSGAIWGIIHIDNKEASVDLGRSMMDKLGMYKLDKLAYLNEQNVFMGCGLQYITRESYNEILPLYDETKGLMITADAIIDNREELLNAFKVSKDKWNHITDSELIIMAYDEWGQECPNHLIGDFSFAIWDDKKKELFCARDHVGKRTFYYYYSDNIFAFCTVMKPLFNVFNTDVELNERWLADFLALTSVIHESECNETVYKDIYQLPPAYACTIGKKGFHMEQYWNPLKDIQPLRFSSDKEYDEAFKKVFSEAVHCRLRSKSDIGIMLSGGLDSGSVACIAAKKLYEKGKQLYAFSSIPMKGYKDNTNEKIIANESEYIEAISDYAGNIDVTYCRSEGKNSLKDIDWFLEIYEQPYKVVENTFWYNEIAKASSKKGCKVLLDGQYGNFTISYGDFKVHALTLYREKKFITLAREIKAFSKVQKSNPYKACKDVVKIVMPYKLRKIISERRNRNHNRFDKSPINIELLKKWNIKSRLDAQELEMKPQRYLDLREMHSLIVNPLILSQAGAIETKVSLKHGIMKRDPTRDKRVIEFCLRLPSNQFVRNGQERNLIRRSMEGILPDKVRLNVSTRGVQSIDWIQRIVPDWSWMCNSIESHFKDSDITQYINVDKIKEELSSMRNYPDENKWYVVRMIIITFILGEFIKKFYK